jgi:hypothetical protein
MYFSGWVPLRRGLIEHLQDGRLTVKEFSVLVVLIMLASKDSGSGTMNANTLAAYMGEDLNYESGVPRNRQRGKQRVLHNLEAKGYIYRQIVPHSKRAYHYWVNKYEITDGPNKSRRLDLIQVFESKDVADIRYTLGASQGVVDSVAESVAHTVAHPVTSNKKEKEKDTQKREEPSGTPASASIGDFGSDSHDYSAKQARREGECASGSSLKCASMSALPVAEAGMRGLPVSSGTQSNAARERTAKATADAIQFATVLDMSKNNIGLLFDATLRWNRGYGVFEDLITDRAVSMEEAHRRLLPHISQPN